MRPTPRLTQAGAIHFVQAGPMIRRFSSTAVLLLLAAACTPAEEETVGAPAAEVATTPAAATVDIAAEEQRIRELNGQFLAAVQRGDADAAAAVLAPDGRFMAPNMEAAEGTAAIRAAWTEAVAIPGFSLSFEPTEIVVASNGEMAYDVGTYESSFDGPSGPIENHGKYVTVWTKVDGQWRIAADIFNTDLPAQP
ncbi:MAG: YybH family protein [Planctomycetaceae bacterium]